MSTETTVLCMDGRVDHAATARHRRIAVLSGEFAEAHPPPWDDPEDVPEPGSADARAADAWHDDRWDWVFAGLARQAGR